MKKMFFLLFLMSFSVTLTGIEFNFKSNYTLIEKWEGENYITTIKKDSCNIYKHPKSIVINKGDTTDIYKINYEYEIQILNDSIINITFDCIKDTDKYIIKYTKFRNFDFLNIENNNHKFTFYKEWM